MSVFVKTAMGGDDVDRSAVRARFLDRLAVSDITAANSPDGRPKRSKRLQVLRERTNAAEPDGWAPDTSPDEVSADLGRQTTPLSGKIAPVSNPALVALNPESLVTAPRPAKLPEAGNNPSPVSGAYSPWRAHRPHLEPLARRVS